MSGGVDSAAAAQLALDAGDDVLAVTLELWSDPGTDGEQSCCSPQAVTAARALAHGMGIPHITLDLRDRFREGVVDDYLAGYASGSTPNPCVRCNGLVRFDAMLELAGRLGAGKLATGHYARIADDGEGPLVRAGVDPAKDQSYVLARLTGDELARLSFPLGELEKPRVRELARSAGLPVADKRESQDLCFLAGTQRAGVHAPPRRPAGRRRRDRGPRGPSAGPSRRAPPLHRRPAQGHRRGRARAALRAGQGRPPQPGGGRARAELATRRVAAAPSVLHRRPLARRIRAAALRGRADPVLGGGRAGAACGSTCTARWRRRRRARPPA